MNHESVKESGSPAEANTADEIKRDANEGIAIGLKLAMDLARRYASDAIGARRIDEASSFIAMYRELETEESKARDRRRTLIKEIGKTNPKGESEK